VEPQQSCLRAVHIEMSHWPDQALAEDRNFWLCEAGKAAGGRPNRADAATASERNCRLLIGPEGGNFRSCFKPRVSPYFFGRSLDFETGSKAVSESEDRAGACVLCWVARALC
jgi:hypothetical protein